MSEKFEKRLFKLSIAFLLLLLIFGYGIAVGRFKFFPYQIIYEMYDTALSLKRYGRIVPENLLVKASKYRLSQTLKNTTDNPFLIQKPSQMMEGYYIFQIWDDQNQCYSALLYNHLGKHLHTWPLDYKTFDPDGPSNGSDQPHGFAVFPDGSVMVNYDNGDVMVRIDSCGNAIWIKKGVFHHSLQKGEDGSFWTWRAEGSAYSQYQYLHNFDPETGATIREIGLIEDLIINNKDAYGPFLIRFDYEFEHFESIPKEKEKSADIFHPNDIDVLSSDMTPVFPDFKAGDLLISIRNLNLVAVLDPNTLTLKWWRHGPWRAQHDPDFTSDGKISVYNNNVGLHRSEIIKIDPNTGKINNDLCSGEARFYSSGMGKHQYLPNGNVLIVVPEEGRIIVVTATGKIVMEYNNVSSISDRFNGIINNGIWVPSDYFDKIPECKQ